MNWTYNSDRGGDFEMVVPQYIKGTCHSRDVIVCAKIGTKKVVHAGFYKNGKWYNISGVEVLVVKWMDFPFP